MFARPYRGGAVTPLLRRGAAPLLTLLLSLLLAPPGRAQQAATLSGTVVSQESGDPLAGVAISLSGTGLGALTDARGRFVLSGVPAGEHEVVASRMGLGTARHGVHVAPGAVVTLRLSLQEGAVLLPELVVTASGEARRLAETAAAVGVVTREELRRTKPTHPAEVMQRIPGVWVNVTGGEGHATAIRMPKTTEAVYLFLEDGVPTRSTGFFNHNALYEVNLPQAERVEVLKGPATALYGSDAIGGVINVETRSPSALPVAEAYVEGGASGWGRVLLSASGTRGGDGVRAELNLTRTDGWREGTGYDRQSATIRWDHDFGGSTRLRTTLAGSRIDQQTAGSSSLLRDDYLRDPTINYTPISLREVRAARFSSSLESGGEATFVTVTPYLRWNEMVLLPNWSLTYDPTLYSSGHASVGVLARVRHDLAPLRTRLVAGVDSDFSPGGRREHSIVPTRQGQVFTDYSRGDLLYDYGVTYRSFSPYLQAETSPVDRLHLTAGLRYDRIRYDYDSDLEPLQSGRWRRPADTEVSYRHLSPKLGATLDAGEGLNLYASYGHGFRAPSEGQLFRQGSAANTVGLQPVIANSLEAGARGELFGRFGYSIAAYRMTVENDILAYVLPSGQRETQNAGETLHRGVEIALGAALTPELRADLSYSRARHGYRKWSPREGVDYSGNEQESAPNTLWNARIGYAPAFLGSGRVALEASRVGSYWLDPENSHRYAGHTLLTLSGGLPLAHGLELTAKVVNLSDERFAESASYTLARGEELAPGMPRTLFVGAQYRVGGGR